MFQCSNPTMVLICPIGLPTYVPVVTKEDLSHYGGAWQNTNKEKKKTWIMNPIGSVKIVGHHNFHGLRCFD